jgi:outer membrane protein TolC
MSRKSVSQACRRMFCPWAIFLFCVLIGTAGFSDLVLAAEGQREGGEVALGLHEAVDLALRGMDTTGPEIARWRLKEEEGRLWPTLSAQGRAWAYNGLVAAQPGGATFLPGTNYLGYNAGLELDYDILQLLGSRLRIRGIEAEGQASRFRLTQQQCESALKVSGAYLTLLSERESLGYFDQLRREQIAFLKQQEAKFAENAIPMIEVVRARSQVVSADRESLAARRRAASAELELRRLTGLKPEDRIVLAFDPGEVDLSFITARGLKGLLDLAKDANPRLLGANAESESARWQTQAAHSVNYPRLNLSMFYGYGEDQVYHPDSTSSGARYSVYLTLNIPLFDGGVRRAQIVQSELRAESQQREERRTAAETKNQVEDAYWSFLEREQARDLLEQQIRLADDEFKQASARAGAGLAPPGEPLAVLTRLVRLKQDLARTRADAAAMGIGLALAVGRNPFIVPPPSSASSLRGQIPARPVAFTSGSQITVQAISLDDHTAGVPVSTDQSAITAAMTGRPEPLSPASTENPMRSADGFAAPEGRADQLEPGIGEVEEGSGYDARAANSPPERLDNKMEQIVPSASAAPPPPNPPAQAQPAQVLEGIRVTHGEGSTMVMILSTGKIAKYVGYQLRNPPRFVIELQELLEAKADLARPLLINTPQLKGIRIGRHPDKTRIVFDLPRQSATQPQVTPRDDGLLVILGSAQ